MAVIAHTVPNIQMAPKSAPSAREGEPFNAGDFRIDMDRRTASLRDQRLDLTTDEFDLLVFLVMHPKRVVTAQTTLSTHWGKGRVQQAQFLRILMSLKKKLEMLGTGAHYIRTEPIVVYRFDPKG